ncbi:hypothetical protein [Microbacterium terregens]|uniref:Uncharacterized protein n=1 Tax=Microbacterium terregens TaxID=69363 RepID=A0ABV5T3H7_9MICO
MYDPSDPRATLQKTASQVPAASEFSEADYVRFYAEPPQISDDNRRTWYARGQNFVIEYTELAGELTLERTGQADEYVLYLPGEGITAVVSTPSERAEANGRSLVIVPPGDSTVTVRGEGRVIRMLSHRAEDLTAMAANAQAYATAHLNLAPLVPWPAPVDGYRVRVYDLSGPAPAKPGFRVFRCTTFMVNIFEPSAGPRDANRLSPHSHDDFEQCSFVMQGEFIHHLRWPWTTRRSAWRDDQHEPCAAPSVTVIPAQVIHTSQSVASETNQMLDIFSPPRLDFSLKEGWVVNADEYPLP